MPEMYSIIPQAPTETVARRRPEWRNDKRYDDLRTFNYKVSKGDALQIPRAGGLQRVKEKILSFADRAMSMLGVTSFRAQARYRVAHLQLSRGIDRFARAICAQDYKAIPDAFRDVNAGLRRLAECGVHVDELKEIIREQVKFQMVRNGEIKNYADVNTRFIEATKLILDDFDAKKTVTDYLIDQADVGVRVAILDSFDDIGRQILECGENKIGCGRSSFDADYMRDGFIEIIDCILKIKEDDASEVRKNKIASDSKLSADSKKAIEEENKIYEKSKLNESNKLNEKKQINGNQSIEAEFVGKYGKSAYKGMSRGFIIEEVLSCIKKDPKSPASKMYLDEIGKFSKDLRDEKYDANKREMDLAFAKKWSSTEDGHKKRIGRIDAGVVSAGKKYMETVRNTSQIEAKNNVIEQKNRIKKSVGILENKKEFLNGLSATIQVCVGIVDANRIASNGVVNRWGKSAPIKIPDGHASKDQGLLRSTAEFTEKLVGYSRDEWMVDVISRVGGDVNLGIALDAKKKIISFNRGGENVEIGSLDKRDVDSIIKSIEFEIDEVSYLISSYVNGKYFHDVGLSELEANEFKKIMSAKNDEVASIKGRAGKLVEEITLLSQTARSMLYGQNEYSEPVPVAFEKAEYANASKDNSYRLNICGILGVESAMIGSSNLVGFVRLDAEKVLEIRNSFIFELEAAIAYLSAEFVLPHVLTAVENAMKDGWKKPVNYNDSGSPTSSSQRRVSPWGAKDR